MPINPNAYNARHATRAVGRNKPQRAARCARHGAATPALAPVFAPDGARSLHPLEFLCLPPMSKFAGGVGSFWHGFTTSICSDFEAPSRVQA